jgi:hypothetical protein
MPTHFDEYERQARDLQHISGRLDRGGSESISLERAGWALAFVTMYHFEQFEQFLAEKDSGELSEEQLAFLKKCGLE